jgi:hypothetical protein
MVGAASSPLSHDDSHRRDTESGSPLACRRGSYIGPGARSETTGNRPDLGAARPADAPLLVLTGARSIFRGSVSRFAGENAASRTRRLEHRPGLFYDSVHARPIRPEQFARKP